MKIRLIRIITSLVIMVAGVIMLTPSVVSADFKEDACQGVNALNGGAANSKCDPNAGVKVDNLITNIIKLLSVVVGFVAVIMLIVGGLKFITAGGDSGAVASARNTIIYALIGLVVVAVAQILVHYVIRKTT